jgi:hypothetical protein
MDRENQCSKSLHLITFSSSNIKLFSTTGWIGLPPIITLKEPDKGTVALTLIYDNVTISASGSIL